MIRLKVITHKGDIATIYKHENLKTVERYLDLVIRKNEAFRIITDNYTFSNGSKGLILETSNGNILSYFIQ